MNEIMNEVGPYAWGLLHHIAETLPCPTCSRDGASLMRGLHDLVNVELKKPAKYPEDLLRLRDLANRAVNTAKLNPGPCEAKGHAENLHAVCHARLKCP